MKSIKCLDRFLKKSRWNRILSVSRAAFIAFFFFICAAQAFAGPDPKRLEIHFKRYESQKELLAGDVFDYLTVEKNGDFTPFLSIDTLDKAEVVVKEKITVFYDHDLRKKLNDIGAGTKVVLLQLDRDRRAAFVTVSTRINEDWGVRLPDHEYTGWVDFRKLSPYLKTSTMFASGDVTVEIMDPYLVISYGGRKHFMKQPLHKYGPFYSNPRILYGHYLLLQGDGYEYGDYAIFDMDKGVIAFTFYGEPMFSPDRSMFISIGSSYSSYPDELYIFEIKGGKIEKVLGRVLEDGSGYSTCKASWSGNNRIEILFSEGGLRITLMKTASGWAIVK